MADINDLKTNPIEGINVKPNKSITLGAVMGEEESDANKERRRAAIDGIDSSNAEVLPDGGKIITPSMIPTTEDPDAPDVRSMEEKTMDKLHDVITRKKEEAAAEINMFIEQSKANEKIMEREHLQIDNNGNAVNEDGSLAELSEEDNLEAALDAEIATERNLSDFVGVKGAPLSDPNHVYEQVDDDEFDALMRADDEANGKFEDANLEANKAAGVDSMELADPEDTEPQDLQDYAAEVEGYDVEPGDINDIQPEPIKPEAPEEKFTVLQGNKNESLIDELKDAGVYDEDDSADLSAEEEKKEMEEFVAESKKTFGLAPDIIDLSEFTDAPPVSATSVLSSLTTGEAQTASDWALWDSKMPLTLSKFKGVDLKNLSDAGGGRRSTVNTLYERMRIIYDHDMNPNKPDTLEGWAKSIATTDADDLWFTVYDAAFHNANHIPCVCEKCGHSFISQHIPVSEMVKYLDDDFKREFLALRDSAPRKTSRYNPGSKLIPITNEIAVAVKPADMYDYGFIIRLIGQDFYKKYKDVVDILPNIEDFYHIDIVNKKKQRISTTPRKSAQGDSIKEIKNRIIIYNRIIKELDSDQYALLVMYASRESVADDNAKRITYEIPEIPCPKCGAAIEARPLNGGGVEQLVFDRRPLAAITIS